MKIIIAGGGKIGHSVASILADEGHDITVIDHNSDRVSQLSNSLDVICFEGSATNAESLREAAEIDGAGPIRTLVTIYLPLSKAVLATLALFYAVGRWNGFSDALLYLKKREDLYPIQLLLYNILQNATNVEVATQEGFSTPGLGETLKMATVMFATVPILLIYPWLQRYFVTGVTLGAVKG